VRSRLRELGVSPVRLAQESGLTVGALRSIMAGAVVPSIATALLLAQVLEVEVEELFVDRRKDS
jgi:transcriptional regulator with XRE-family HTH domain